MSYIACTRHLTKVFDGKEAVSDVSMNIRKGEVYGFLGPNGAGKTTVMKMLTTLIKPTNGEIEIFGEKLTDTSYEILKRIGCIVETPVFYEKLNAYDNLDLHCEYMGFYDRKAIKEALNMVHLDPSNQKAVKHFSLGMKQRLAIARAITTKPELLILDEPINGLDPVGIKEMRSLFKTLSREYGITLLISSHLLGEIEQVADTIGVIQNGKLLREVSMDSIQGTNTEYIELLTTDCRKASYVLEHKLQTTQFKVVSDSLIRIYDSTRSQAELSKQLILNDVEIMAINRKSHSLEDYFMTLIDGGVSND